MEYKVRKDKTKEAHMQIQISLPSTPSLILGTLLGEEKVHGVRSLVYEASRRKTGHQVNPRAEPTALRIVGAAIS